ncbi:MAG: 30S ribosomal protein S17 [bacterium]|nr:30S ribosomal protein S17 [bacterium]
MPLGKRKEFVGLVKSDRMEKTVVVRCTRRCSDRVYGKVLNKYSNFMAENPDNKAKIGDKVRIIETRPLSRNKRWFVVEILEKKLATGDSK